jgi:processive 1,2-diacylglycerol beta-glucosyltransferase
MRAASAVADELDREDPDNEVRLVDVLDGCRLSFRAAYVWPYWLMIRHLPWLWGRLFDARVRRRHEQTAPLWAFRLGCPQVFDLIREFGPDMIVAMEVAACEIACAARRSGATQARIISVLTDHEAEPVWVKAEVDSYIVPTQSVGQQLHAWGVAASAIQVCGIPIAADFHKKQDKAQDVRARYGLIAGAPLVLLMGGGMGPTRMDKVAARLTPSRKSINVVAVAGRDTRMQRRLSRMRTERPSKLVVLGWTDDIAALMQAAEVLVTKPGGVTTAEAAACQLPMILFDAIPGPEQSNARLFADAGAAVITRGPTETADAVLQLVYNERLRRVMAARSGMLARPSAAIEIARLILGDRAAAGTTMMRREESA